MSEKRNIYEYLFNVDFRKYYEILVAQKSFIIVFVLSAILSSLALTYFFSEKYQSGVTIYYQPIETSLMRQKDTAAFGAPAPSAPFKVIVQTLSDIIKSEAILRQVVVMLELDKEIKAEYSTWYEKLYNGAKDLVKKNAIKLWTILKYGRLVDDDPTVKAIKKLRENIDIKATKDSYVYVLLVRDKFPKRAARIVDTAGQLLVDWLKEQDTNPAEQKLIQLKKHLDNKETVLSEMRDRREYLLQSNSIISVLEEKSEGVESLYEIEKEYLELTSEIERKRKKIIELQNAIHNKHKGYANPDDLKKLESEKLFEEIELKGLVAQADSLQVSVKNLKARLQNMLKTEKQVETLNMKIEADMREYIHVRDMYLETLSQATTSASEVKIMHHAVVPSKPVQPIKIYHVSLSGILSLFFATGLVYVFAFFNIRMFFVSKGMKGRRNSVERENGKS